MCELKRVNILKKRSEKIVEQFKEQDPLSVLPYDYVSSSGLTRSDIYDKIEKLQGCASILELRENFIENPDKSFEQVMSVAAANYCRQHTVCPLCADRMQSRRRAKFDQSIREQSAAVAAGTRYAYMITYTIADGPDLGERLEHLKESKKAFRKMGQRRRGIYKRSGGEAGKIAAGIGTIEIKRGKDSHEWHAHSHDLVFTDAPIDYTVYNAEKKRKLLQQHKGRVPVELLNTAAMQRVNFNGQQVAVSKVSHEWFLATDGDSISIEIDKIQHVPRGVSHKKRRMYEKMSFADSVAYQAKECLKYPYKVPQDRGIADALVVLNETYNKRMTATYGEFRGVSGDDYNEDGDRERDSYVMTWKNGKYSDPIPGNVRDIDTDPAATDARKLSGIALGDYRRRRKWLVGSRSRLGSDLSEMLNDSKDSFQRRIKGIWATYRNKINAAKRLENARCDKYSPILAAAGHYIPNSDSRNIYQAAFT